MWKDDGRIFEGVIDVAYLREGTWTVLDFKSDLSGQLPSRYQRQLQWYAYSLQKLTGLPARAFLLSV